MKGKSMEELNRHEIAHLIESQKRFYQSGKTRTVDFRKDMLTRLKQAILDFEPQITKALYQDLRKSEQEVVMTEIGITLTEINGMLKNLSKWDKPKKVKSTLIGFGAKSYTMREPFGTTLIIGPWNYPFQLAIAPLIGAIAGGNTAVIKPSEISICTSKVIKKMISKTFNPAYIGVVQGGVEETTELLNHRFDKIFFTGSTQVGSIVMQSAAKFLTPVILELGGKSPCIIDKDVNLKLAVKRIVFGKGMNAGQTCVAPDYVIVHESIKQQFYDEFKRVATLFYGRTEHDQMDFCKIINDRNFNRVRSYLNDGKIVYGGGFNEESHHIDLTLLEIRSLDSSVMKEEIFGPILPVLTFQTIEDIIEIVERNPDPLALYIFSDDKKFQKKILGRIHFGGGCINDTIMHLTNENLPFGGRGTSGLGNYHGKYSFDAFTHEKSISHSPTWFDLKLKYPPFSKKRVSLIKKIMYK